MHRTRQETSFRIPIARKGTKYVARAYSHLESSVPVVVAIRDMLKLATTSKEVKEMIKAKQLQINGRIVEQLQESIQLFHLLQAEKTYQLSLLPSGRFTFVEHKGKERLAKIMSRTLVAGKKLQLNLHDGTNVIGKSDMHVGDSLYLDSKNKIMKHVQLGKGSTVFIMSGSYTGQTGKLTARAGNQITVQLPAGTNIITQAQAVAQ